MVLTCLTKRLINRIETKVGHNDPIFACGSSIA